jgi:2-dehydro-3-deoxyglucarate aldolase
MACVDDIRSKLRNGRPSIGSWLQIPNDAVAAIMGAAGFDWVAVDLEHGRFPEDALPSLFRAIAAGGSAPFARVGTVSPYAIKASLDGGAVGIILPMIDSVELLRDAIAWAHYPPRGTRGIGFSAANLFGKQFDRHLKEADPIVVAQIEDTRAVACIDALIALQGLDAVMIGPYDLSASLGITGQFDNAAFRQVLADVASACRRHGVASGVHVVVPERDRLWSALQEGHQFVAYGTDASFLWKNAEIPNLN